MGMCVDGDPSSVFDAALQRGHRQLPLPQQNLRQVQKAVQMLQDKHASSFLVQIQKAVQMNPLPPMCMSGCITSHVYVRIATLFLSRDGKMHYIPCLCQVAASPLDYTFDISYVIYSQHCKVGHDLRALLAKATI